MSIRQAVYQGAQKAIAISGVCAAMALSSMSAQANTITSNDLDCTGNPITRTFSVTATSVVKCLMKGSGNINGNTSGSNPDMFLTSTTGAGYSFLDASDTTGGLLNGVLGITGGGTTGGGFTVASSVYSSYKDIAIGFKSGNGGIDPDWAIFQLTASTLTGTWSIDPTQAGGLSHAILYGKLCAPGDNCGGGGANGNGAPEPATLALVGLALLGVAAAKRRQQT
jgi:PEP-CTERM motif